MAVVLAMDAEEDGEAWRGKTIEDGLAANWSVWREHFSHYTPILDFVYALMYVSAAAMSGRPVDKGWTH
ncbi:MAG: hypothetical protein WD875_15815 [Pirellulales bacterium]